MCWLRTSTCMSKLSLSRVASLLTLSRLSSRRAPCSLRWGSDPCWRGRKLRMHAFVLMLIQTKIKCLLALKTGVLLLIEPLICSRAKRLCSKPVSRISFLAASLALMPLCSHMVRLEAAKLTLWALGTSMGSTQMIAVLFPEWLSWFSKNKRKGNQRQNS